MNDQLSVLSRIIQLVEETEGTLDSDALIDADPLNFKRARQVFGSWEDALVAALVHNRKGSGRHKVTRTKVVEEGHHERTKMDGWDTQLLIHGSDRSLFSMSGADFELSRDGAFVPFAPRGEQLGIERITPNPDEDALVVLSTSGVMHHIDSRVVPHFSRPARSCSDVVGMPSQDGVAAMLTRSALRAGRRFVHATGGARIKASSVHAFGRGAQVNGTTALVLAEGDGILEAFVEGQEHTAFFCANAAGNGIRFNVGDVRTMGLKAQGVKSMAIAEFDAVVGALPVGDEGQILVISAMGSAKRVPLSQFRIQGRAGQGMILMRPHLAGDEIATVLLVKDLDEDLLAWTQRGCVARIPVGTFALADRAAKGQDLLCLDSGDRLAGAVIIPGAG